LITTDGQEIVIQAAPEPLLEVTGDSLHRIAWHIGNRHTPCQIEEVRLLIQRDHVIKDMLEKIGATVAEVVEPFTPEGGAYGHGRTHGHDHSHTHGPDGHSHDH
jgi:urease accessory protein